MPALPNDPILMKLQGSSLDDEDLLEHRLSETDGALINSVEAGGGGVTEVFVVVWFWTTVWIDGDGVTDVDSGDVSELVAAVLAVPVVLKINWNEPLTHRIVRKRKLLLTFPKNMWLSPSKALRWSSFELYRSPWTVLLCCLNFRTSSISKSGSHSKEILSSRLFPNGCT